MKAKLLFSIVLMLCIHFTVSSQTMTTYTWDSYKMKFDIPTSFNVKVSSGEKFEAANNDINLSIYPRKGENLSADGMISALDTWVIENNVGNKTDKQVISDQLNGYWGVFQEGTVGGWPVFLMLVVDPDYSDISFYVWVSYREGTEDTAVKILKSFKPI